MKGRTLNAHFAPTERVPIEVVRRQASAVARAGQRLDSLGATRNRVFVLNHNHQVVYSSPSAREFAGQSGMDRLLGRRLGEVLHCLHATEGSDGCGTGAACAECGALRAILESLVGLESDQTVRMTRFIDLGEETVDLRIASRPIELEGETYVLVTVS